MPDDNFPDVTITAPTLAGVATIQYVITDKKGQPDTMTYHAELIWSDGSRTQANGDATRHLTTPELNGLNALVNRLRAKAEATWGVAE